MFPSDSANGDHCSWLSTRNVADDARSSCCLYPAKQMIHSIFSSSIDHIFGARKLRSTVQSAVFNMQFASCVKSRVAADTTHVFILDVRQLVFVFFLQPLPQPIDLKQFVPISALSPPLPSPPPEKKDVPTLLLSIADSIQRFHRPSLCDCCVCQHKRIGKIIMYFFLLESVS